MGQEHMHANLEVYKHMFDAISRSQAVIEFELDGTVISANDNFLNAMGYSAEEVIGQHHKMFVDPAYQGSAEYRDFWDKLGRGEFDSGEYKRLGKGGKKSGFKPPTTLFWI